MEFTAAGIFNRAITIERTNTDIYKTQKETDVYVNGEKVLTTDRNVFTLADLEPDQDVIVKIDDVSHTFHTRKETVKLNVKDFGAKADGKTDDTNAIQAAIMNCPKDGSVYVPAGTYFVRPLFLRSNMTLYMDKDAELLGDPDRNHYPLLPGMVQGTDEKSEYSFSSWEGNPLTSFASLITAVDCENTTIIGGTLNGNADNSDWWDNHKKKRIAWRPNTIFFNQCQNMTVSHVTVKNSPCWTIHPYYSDHLKFMDLYIQNPYNSPNTDGFDPESCTDVLLLGTRISVGDDCVAIKSGKIYMATAHCKPTRDVTIRNCDFERGHGSVTVGSEIAGGVYNVNIDQCLFDSTDRGVRIKTRRGRGQRSVLDQIQFDHVMMKNVPMAMTFNMFYYCDPDGHSAYVQDQNYHEPDDMTPAIGTISVKNVTVTGADSAFLCAYGLPEKPIGKIELENVDASFLPEEELKEGCPIMMDNFEPVRGVGIWAGNVDTLSMKNVVIRHALVHTQLKNITNKDLDSLSFED